MTSTIAPTSSTSQAVTEWVKIFPKQATENYTSSVTFMKQLTVVAISTISYLKSAFPEDSYMVESFGGLKLRIIKKKCRDECAQFLSTSLSQAFEAFDKRYLHQLALCFYEEECKIENLIEYHIFDYSYHGDGVTMNVHSKHRDNIKHAVKFTFENVRERTIHMIRSCVILMQTCQNELPLTYNVSLRLYYNDDAPWDYQAPGFQSTGEAEDHLAGCLAETLRLGWVETSFHKLLASSYIKDNAEASHEAIASQNPPVITLEDDERSDAVTSAPGTPEEADAAAAGGGSGDQGSVRCPCNLRERGAGPPPALLTCHYCGTRQHAACFGVRGAHAALVSRHCCADCYDADRTRLPTDGKLAMFSDRKRECLCIFRRTLEWCTERPAVDAAALRGALRVSEPNALKLMKLLHSHKLTEPTAPGGGRDDTPQTIRRDRLKSVIDKFFQSSAEDDVVDRLLAETFASQESRSDPVSEVLSPLEQVSLRDATGGCRIARRPDGAVEDVLVEDSTLERYREAILAGDKAEELASVTEAVAGLGGRGGVRRKTVKRKMDEGATTTRFGLRSGVKTKRARTLNK